MSRKRIKELHDYAWYPACMREYMTDFLAFFALHFFQYNPVFPLVRKVVQECGVGRIRDLCSGAASCIPRLERFLNDKHACAVQIELTDKFPNLKAFEQAAAASGGRVTYSASPVDALQAPEREKEFLIMFSAVHHFSPEELERILSGAMDKACPVGFFDYATRNHVLTLLLMPGLIPLIWCVTPFLRPFSWTRLFFTYILPFIPVLIFIDGFISRWNAYSSGDFGTLGSLAEQRGWVCESGTLPNFFHTGEVLYFICRPPCASERNGM